MDAMRLSSLSRSRCLHVLHMEKGASSTALLCDCECGERRQNFVSKIPRQVFFDETVRGCGAYLPERMQALKDLPTSMHLM